MKRFSVLWMAPVVLAACATSAQAQDAGPMTASPRAYFTGIGGAAFNLEFDDPSPSFAAEYGERVHRDVYAYANFRYIDNLMTDFMRAELQRVSVDGGPSYSGRDRALTFTLGAKYLFPGTRRFRPYFGGGLGLLNLKRRITEQTLGDVSESFFAMTGVNDGVIDAGATAATTAMADVMVGFAGALANRTYLDVAFKYGTSFHRAERVDFGQVTLGIGVAF